jgi:hypothetical protein
MDGMEKPHTVWTCHDAVPAADAPLTVNQYNPVHGLVGSPNRADLDTGRLFALVAELGNKKPLAIWSAGISFSRIFVSVYPSLPPNGDSIWDWPFFIRT